MSGVLSRHDNVVDVDFRTDPPPPGPVRDDSWWPWAEGAEQLLAVAAPGSSPAATRPLPARWSPRPVLVVRRRFARSQLAADLRRYGMELWVLGCALGGLWIYDQVFNIPTYLGGTP